jgi:hypothetical protein
MSLPVPFPTDGDIEQKTQIGYHRRLWQPSSFDYTSWEDSFTGDALLPLYPAAKTNGTSAAVTFTEHNVNKYLSLVSGTADDGYAGQGVGMQYAGDRGVLLEGIVRTPSAVTTLKIEFGLSDADDDAGAVNVKATPSATATDFAVFIVDTDDDANIAFISAKAGTRTATQDIQAVAASTTYRFAIRVEGDAVSGWLNGTQVAGGAHVIEGGTALTPWCFVQARAGSASRTIQLHKWRVLQPAY